MCDTIPNENYTRYGDSRPYECESDGSHLTERTSQMIARLTETLAAPAGDGHKLRPSTSYVQGFV